MLCWSHSSLYYNNIMYYLYLQACSGHPNIVYLYGVCNPNCDRPMIVTALYTVSGKPQTLADALPLTRCIELVQVLVKILEGLQFIHRKRILHNDIKCDNIVLTDTLPCDAPRDQKIWPIIIDFNKASPFKAAKQYNLSKKWRNKYKVKYTQLAPDLVDGAGSSAKSFNRCLFLWSISKESCFGQFSIFGPRHQFQASED